jgi:quinol monooxygenase YgiN
MYARLVMFTLGPGTRPTGEKLAEQFAPALRAMKGFKSVTFFLDDTVGEYGAFVLWESKEDAEAAIAVLDLQLQQALTGIVQGPPTLGLFEVYEPKA